MRLSTTLILGIILSAVASAQPGYLVNSFGDNGLSGLDMPTVTHEFKATAVQADGKIVCVGFINGGGENNFLVCRFLDNGTLDPDFGTAGILTFDLFDGDSYWAVALQPDGKIVAAGLTGTNNEDRMIVSRINSNGTLDASFGTAGTKVIDLGTPSDRAWAVAIQTNGKIVVAGNTLTGTNDFDLALVRLNTDGSFDTSFSMDGWTTLSLGTDCSARGVLVQDDGKIVACGWSNSSTTYAALIARFTSNGTLDPSFNGTGVAEFNATPGISEDEFFAVELRSDQKLVAIGSSFEPEGDIMLAQFNTDGTIDTGFGMNGYRVYPDVNGNFDKSFAGYLQPNGKIVLSGLSALSNGDRQIVVMRTEANGDPDIYFGVNGLALYNVGLENDAALGCAMAQNGDVIAAGYTGITGSFNGILLRFNGVDVLGIEDHAPQGALTVFPVPFKERFTVQFEWTEHATPSPIVTDALGRVVPMNVVTNTGAGNGMRSLELAPLDDLPAGVYLVQVVGDRTVMAALVIKEKEAKP